MAWRLAFLVLVGAFAGAWLATIQRRRSDVVRFTDVALLDVVAPERAPWRRHLPAALWLVALALLVLGFARPARDVDVARDRAIVILTLDVSLSMQAEDVSPTRLDAAKEAAVSFVEDLPDEVEVGLVLFSGSVTGHAPTSDRERLVNTIDNAQLGPYTAIGDAIFRALELIEEEARLDDEGTTSNGSSSPPGRIVLLSDGETTTGRPDDEAAAAAAGAGVAVDTISFGTAHGVMVDELGITQPVPVAPGPLREIAATTGGEFYETESLSELSTAYRDITATYTTTRTERRDISAWFIGAGLMLLTGAGGLALLWSQRLP